MKNEKTPQVHQKSCEACEQVITLGAPNSAVRYCFDCIDKLEAYQRELDEVAAIVYNYHAEPKV